MVEAVVLELDVPLPVADATRGQTGERALAVEDDLLARADGLRRQDAQAGHRREMAGDVDRHPGDEALDVVADRDEDRALARAAPGLRGARDLVGVGLIRAVAVEVPGV